MFDVTSYIYLYYSEHARHYIHDTGVNLEYTYVVGFPIAEVLDKLKEKSNQRNMLE